MTNKSRSLCSKGILEFKKYDFIYLSDNYYDKLHLLHRKYVLIAKEFLV